MDFRFETDVSIRFRDLDVLGHVNNAVYATYLEQARLRYFDRVLDVPWEEREVVLANLQLDFARPLRTKDGTVRIACGVREIGGSSLRMKSRVFPPDGDAPAATAEATVVAVEDGSPREIPPEWRERFTAFEPEL